MRTRLLAGWATLCLYGVAAASARADDSAVIGVGGAVRPMRRHPSVRMVSEEVYIKVPEAAVRARFVFHNDGPSTTLLIGFPEEGKDIDPKGSYSHLQGFRSYVDGQPVKVRRVIQENPTQDSDFYYQYWWVKRVRFARGQTRTITDRYVGGTGFNTVGHNWFSYILKTGATWKGPIGHARIVCDVRGLHDYAPWHIAPAGYRRTRRTLVWDFYNIKPTQNIEIRWPVPFLNVEVNGTPVVEAAPDSALPMWMPTEKTAFPRKRGREVWLAVRTAAQWLDAELMVAKSANRIRLQRGNKGVEIAVGSRRLHTDDGDLVMSRAAYLQQGSTMVALSPLVRALGGTTAFDRHDKMNVRLP